LVLVVRCAFRIKESKKGVGGSMDGEQQRQVEAAAEKFAEAIKESFQAVADRTVTVQQLNAELTQSFFNGVIENLRVQAEENRSVTEEFVDQQERQREAARMLTQESVDLHMDFIASMFSYYQEMMQQTRRQAGAR